MRLEEFSSVTIRTRSFKSTHPKASHTISSSANLAANCAFISSVITSGIASQMCPNQEELLVYVNSCGKKTDAYVISIVIAHQSKIRLPFATDDLILPPMLDSRKMKVANILISYL